MRRKLTSLARLARRPLSTVNAGRVAVVANESAVAEAGLRGNMNFGEVPGRAGHNNPELRRNLLAKALAQEPAADLVGAAPGSLETAERAHGKGFVNFLGTAFERWETELRRDASYLSPQVDVEAAPTALVPFHFVKERAPRAPGLAAEFACYGSDFETPIQSMTAAVLAEDLGVVEDAVRRCHAEEHRAVYALTTHPGHHAGPGYFGGFCYVNTASVACALFEEASLSTALLDVDFHGGNGSYDIARESGRWFRSIDCAGAYPWVEMGEVCVRLPPGTGWADGYAEALDAALSDLPAGTDALVVSLGFDTLATDPEAGKRGGNLGLTARDFGAMGRVLAERGPERLVVVQEGGYDLEGIPDAAVAFVRGLAGHE